ncbi:hypothetical protein Aple_029880 [Acrocarpospora pleiomorpha]|uniref:Alcohol dehydrogenase-like C-terminal domain-containing protein n=1 Tax=Acrocarpospora pleiomorpha TaxID=90975 RepID=A0A5M3XH10_9ACTN|nr:hypothetical protein Aple_029880 [Acrocarpospora pleiomorpha]
MSRRSNGTHAEAIVIFGAGGVGLSAVLGAMLAGANPIVVVDVVAERLAMAERLGATHTLVTASGFHHSHARQASGRVETDVLSSMPCPPSCGHQSPAGSFRIRRGRNILVSRA